MFEVFARDDETAALHREATALADAGDLKGAVDRLRKATKRMGTSPVSYPVLTWLRLPLYLQKAGQFKDAMVEFNNIIEDTDRRINHGCPSGISRESKSQAKHADLQTIYDKMRLACKREGLHEEAAKYAEISNEHRHKFRKLYDKLVMKKR